MNGLQGEQRQELRGVHVSKFSSHPTSSLAVSLGLRRKGRGSEPGRDGGLATSDVEAFTAAACALDIRVVEDKFTGQL